MYPGQPLSTSRPNSFVAPPTVPRLGVAQAQSGPIGGPVPGEAAPGPTGGPGVQTVLDGPVGSEVDGGQPAWMGPVLLMVAAGAAVSLAIGVYGRTHTPTGELLFSFGFSSTLSMKAWFTTVAATLGLAQAASALWLWGRLPGAGSAPAWVAPAHRWTGTLAFFFTLPVAYHCLWALGFQTTTTRVLVHSILGCAFYGALTTKLLLLRSSRLPGAALPLAGGLLVALLTGLWLTSSLWFFTTVAFPGF